MIAGSSNGRTTPFGGVCRGSTPLPAAKMMIKFVYISSENKKVRKQERQN